MQDKEDNKILNKILENGNTLLEAGIIEGVLQLKLTVSESPDVKKRYFAGLKRLDENEKLKENFETLNQVFEWMNDHKNFKIDEFTVVYLAKVGAKIIEIGRILLKENNEVEIECSFLEEMIDQCSSKGELSNDEIKKNFEVLASEIVELKRLQKGENETVLKFESLKEELMGKANEQNVRISQSYQNLEEKYSTEIDMLRKEIDGINAHNVTQSINFEKLKEIVGSDSLNFQNTLKDKTNEISEDIIMLKEFFIENMKQIESLRNEISNQFEKVEIIESQMKYLEFYINKEKEKLKLEFYKLQKWAGLFKFDGKALSKVKEDFNYQFLFFENIPFNNEFTFKVKIIKSECNCVLVGVVDYDKQKEQQFSYNSNNAVCYDALGYKYPGNIKEGNGFDVGETVKVRVDRKNKTIKWLVNNEQIASLVHEMLGEKNRKLIPYVEMWNAGDTIRYSL